MKPVRKWHSNKKFLAGDIPGVEADLPVTRLDGTNYSIWRCESLRERIKILFSGEVTLGVMGSGQPPVSVAAGDSIRKN